MREDAISAGASPIPAAVRRPRVGRSKNIGGRNALEQLLFPYGADELLWGSWVFFNRDYKVPGTPPGSTRRSIYEVGAPQFKLRPVTADDLAIMCDGRRMFYDATFGHPYMTRRIYFFTDRTVPWESPAKMRRYARVLTHFYSLVEAVSTDRGGRPIENS